MDTTPNGFTLVRGWADVSFAELVESLAWQQPTIRMFGKEIAVPRLTAWMGDGEYTYSGIAHAPAPMPAIISTLRSRLQGGSFNSVLANLYRDGSDSVAYHSDDEPELGCMPTIASVSFGASRLFKIRNKSTNEVTTLTLAHGDLLMMSGRSQLDYQHAVPKTAKPVGSRINLTFRTVS